jgi:hypothetical protein
MNPFTGCTNLSEIIVSPEHPVLAVMDGALISRSDSRLVCYPCMRAEKTCTVPDGICTIGESAFDGCRNLSRIILPDTVIQIRETAFSDCESLAEMTIPDSVTYIGGSAFYRCDSLTVTVPAGSYAEEYCKENDIQYIASP